MYASMTHGSSMRDLCQRLNPQNLRINERRLVQFGLIEGLIRRVYKVCQFLSCSLLYLQQCYIFIVSMLNYSIQYICQDLLATRKQRTIQFISTLQVHTVLTRFVAALVNQLHKLKIL